MATKVTPKEGADGPTPAKKIGWARIQNHTENIRKSLTDEKNGKRMSSFSSPSKVPQDRRHRITHQIDEIRMEQQQRLSERAKAKKKTTDATATQLSCLQRLRRHTIDPRRTWKQIWDVMILVFVLFSAVQIPTLLAFPDIDDMTVLTSFLDVLFIIDFFLCFRTGYIKANNEVEMRQEMIIANYTRTWFPIDLAACFPLDFIVSSGDSTRAKTLLRLLKLPRLLRLGRLFKYLARFKYAGAMKIVRFIVSLIIVAHWTGCFFFFICNVENEYGYETWIEENVGLIVAGENLPYRYLTCLYTAFLMLIGEGMDMVTEAELAFGSAAVLLGTIITAVIVGNVSFVVSNQNSTAYQYQSKIDIITDEMRALHLPGELQARTLEYYEYLWHRHRTFDPSTVRFTADLSPTLRKEILLFMNRECVLNCDFFRDVSNECILRLVHSFKFAVFLKDDALAEEGEFAAELVFIIHGSAKVVKRDRVMPLSLLKAGDYFGEKSLLMHHRNAVSVVATENCDTRVLEKVDFEDLTIDFPELRNSILKRSDHMDVTEYDTHTKRRKTMRASGDMSALSLMPMNIKEIEAASSSGEKDSSGSFPVSPLNSSFSFEPDAAQARPFTAGSKGRLIEMFSTVKVMSDEVEQMQKRQNRMSKRMETIDAKLDKLLIKLSAS